MRDFFKQELKTLYLKTGLQQYAKLSEMKDSEKQIALLLDMLVEKCNHFPLIPEENKKEIVLQYMITDTEFQGFNPKILWKWFNAENRKYLPRDQSQFTEIPWTPPTPEQQAKIDELMRQWKIDMMKIGSPAPRADGIKDVRIQQMKEQFQGIECKHTGLRVPISDTAEVCNDCGKEFETGAADSPVEPTK